MYIYKAKQCRFMGLYCGNVQNDQQDVVIKEPKSTKKLGLKLFSDFLQKRLDFCAYTQYNLNVR